MRRLSMSGLTLVAIGACARNQASIAPSVSQADSSNVRSAIAAQNNLAQAIAARDPAGIVAVLDTNVQLRSWTGDSTYNGAGQVAVYLVRQTADTANVLHIARGTFEECGAQSVREVGSRFSAPTSSGGRTGGYFAALWMLEERRMVAKQLVLDADSVRVRNAFQCDFSTHVARRKTFFTLGVSLERNAVSPTSEASEVFDMLQKHHYVHIARPNTTGPGAESFPQTSGAGWAATIGARFRFTEGIVELRLSVPQQETFQGFDPSRSKYVELTTRPVTLGAFAQVERSRVRMGIGPALVFPSWRLTQWNQSIQNQPGNPNSTFWSRSAASPDPTFSLAATPGLVAELAVDLSWPAAISPELRLHYETFLPSAISTLDEFYDVNVRHSALRIGLAFAGAR